MRLKYRYAISPTVDRHVFNAINELTDRFRMNDDDKVYVIEFYRDEQYGKEIIAIMDMAGIHGFHRVVYNAKELLEAQWIQSTPIWGQYKLQPYSTFPQNTFKTLSCEKCYHECEQIDDFALGTRPNKWKKKFLGINIPDEMLVPDEVAEILSNSELKGFRFRQVVDYKTRKKMPNINQLVVERTLEKGRVYYPGDIREIHHCPVCGFTTVVHQTPQWHRYKAEIFDGVEEDIVKTGEKHRGSLIYRSRLIISHKFYDVLKKNRLDKDLMHSVVDLV